MHKSSKYAYLDFFFSSYIPVFTISKAEKQVIKLNSLSALGERTKSNTESFCKWEFSIFLCVAQGVRSHSAAWDRIRHFKAPP